MRDERQTTSPSVRSLRCAGIWMWLGLWCGFADAAHIAGSRHLLGKLLHQPAGYVWMMPVAYLVAFGVLGLLYAAASTLFPKLRRLAAVMFTPVAFAVFSLTLGFDWLDPWARLALAVGVGLVAARFATARPTVVLMLYRRTRAWTILLLLIAMAAVPALTALSESRHRAALPDPVEGAPNVLLIVLDTVRADHLGIHGYERPTTPSIDALARSSVMFEWAIATAPWTLTSHSSMFTGRYPHQLDADWLVPLGNEYPTLAEVMSENGYATAGFVANLSYCAAENGLSRGFGHYEDYYAEPGVIATSSTLGRKISHVTKYGDPFYTIVRNSAETVTDRFLSWEAEQERPFFAFLNYFDAHAMYIAPDGYQDRFGPPGEHIYDFHSRGFKWSDWSEKEQQGFIDAYDACLRYADDQVGRLLSELERRGTLDDTLVVLTADHGEMLGEHDLLEHGHSLYRPLLHVPLIVRLPGSTHGGASVKETVSLVDLPATILDLAGARVEQPFPGHSLAPLWSGEPGPHPRSAALSELNKRIRGDSDLPASAGNMQSIYHDGFHYVRVNNGREALFDVLSDPGEEHDLIETSPAAPRLRAALEAALK